MTAERALAPEAADVVALHAERTPDPRTVRWFVGYLPPPVPADPGCGRPGKDTAALDELVRAGIVSGYQVEADGVVTTAGEAGSWQESGPAVREAVEATVRRRRSALDCASPEVKDQLLAAVARDVLSDLVGPLAAGHGGAVRLVGARDGVVTVQLLGACHGCPAAAVTLRARLERELRARAPWLRSVEEVEEPPEGDHGRGRAGAAKRVFLQLRRRPTCAPDQGRPVGREQ